MMTSSPATPQVASFSQGTKYRFEGVHSHTLGKMWMAKTVGEQVAFHPPAKGDSGLDLTHSTFIVHEVGDNVAFESTYFPGHFLTFLDRDPDETHPHLRRSMMILEAGTPDKETCQFTLSPQIWTLAGTESNPDFFTLKYKQLILTSGVGGLNFAPYTSVKIEKNWGFVFGRSYHSIIVDLPNGDQIETTPFALSSYGTLGNAINLASNLDYGGHDDWRLPTGDEMLAVIAKLKSLGNVVGGAWWTSEVGSKPNLQKVARWNGTVGDQGNSYPFTSCRAVRNH